MPATCKSHDVKFVFADHLPLLRCGLCKTVMEDNEGTNEGDDDTESDQE
jgi:hypothetical protein